MSFIVRDAEGKPGCYDVFLNDKRVGGISGTDFIMLQGGLAAFLETEEHQSEFETILTEKGFSELYEEMYSMWSETERGSAVLALLQGNRK